MNNFNYSILFGLIAALGIFLLGMACGPEGPSTPSVSSAPEVPIEHLAEWSKLKEGVSVIRDEKNGNLVYVGAVGWMGKSYSIAVTVVPIRR